MALSENQQLLAAIERSKAPLICLPANAGADPHAAAIGLMKALERLGKQVEIATASPSAPKQLQYLKGHERVKHGIDKLQRLVVEVDATKAQVDELSYEVKNRRLYIYLSPKGGHWRQEDVKVASSEYRHDLVITLGASDLASLGKLFEDNPDFFFRTPIINIDVTPDNEHFGQLNAVDLTASSIGEAVHDIVEAVDEGLIDTDVATALLTGMIAGTRSFRSTSVTPKTLSTAGKLVSRGADRDMIVENLYRTRSVETLRLWGRALARLREDTGAKLVWSALSREDFARSGGDEDELTDVLDELVSFSPSAEIAALIYERPDGDARAIIRARPPHDARELGKGLGVEGTPREARVDLPDGLAKAEKAMLEAIRSGAKA